LIGGTFAQNCANAVKAVTDGYDVVLAKSDKAVAGMAHSGAPSAAKRLPFALDNKLRGQKIVQAIASIKDSAANHVGQQVARNVKDEVSHISDAIDGFVTTIRARVEIIAADGAKTLSGLASQLDELIAAARDQVVSTILPDVDAVLDPVREHFAQLAGQLRTMTVAVDQNLDTIDAALDIANQTLKDAVANVKTLIAAAARRHRGGSDRHRRRLQNRPADPLARRFCRDRRDPRYEGPVLCFGDAAVQYDDLDGGLDRRRMGCRA
jgi:hypothetical protein